MSELIFPHSGGTTIVLDEVTQPEWLPVLAWLGVTEHGELPQPGLLAAAGPQRGTPLLVEHSRGSYLRPGLRGHRLAVEPTGPPRGPRDIAGRDWSTAFRPTRTEVSPTRLLIHAADPVAGLGLRTEIETLPGGAIRARHVLTNHGDLPYLLDGLEVAFPLPAAFTDVLDFTGRHEHERAPQRHHIHDGHWLRESRHGKPGLDSASLFIAGTPSFSFARGDVVGLLVATSGNSAMSIERSGATGPTISGGELLLPGEVVLTAGQSYSTPWIVVAAAEGLDGLAASLHQWQRSLESHPVEQPVTLNVWEAVQFTHDVAKLDAIAERASEVGVERFVLDDGWFRGRRNDHAGLGDWWVDEDVWPQGLTPLIKRIHELDMQFGLWFEPEMVNPDSDLFRAHPDWILSAGGRVPLLHRNQLVLDLTNNDVWTYLHDRFDAVLSEHDIDYVKWDHNRDLLEAGSALHAGSPAVHYQNLAYYALLDSLRKLHPRVAWESCSAGGGRVDLAVLERVQRVWTSDVTDALARQHMQRWTAQFVAPEYLGAHVASPTSHQTGRTFTLDFRAATAIFGAFGIEWDLSQATPEELEGLKWWTALHKKFRPLLHSGRTVRLESSDPAVLGHGVIAADRSSALIAHVQIDESSHNRGVVLPIHGLDRNAMYHLEWANPVDTRILSVARPLNPLGPTAGKPVGGAVLADVGLWLPRRRPQTAQLIHISRDDSSKPS